MSPARHWCIGLALLVGFAGTCTAQQPASPAQPGAPASTRTQSATPPSTSKAVRTNRPAWGELTPAQQAALAPLSGTWPTMSEAQKRKWIALAQNFGRMPTAEQGKLHARMNEWVALTPQQRVQARLNFGEVRQMSEAERNAKWEAYQKLSPEEKRRLAAGAAPRPPATAAAVRPIPPQKLANVPRGSDARAPRISLAPLQEQPTVPGAPGAPTAVPPAPTTH